jgi:hypothetical protein
MNRDGGQGLERNGFSMELSAFAQKE